MLALGANGRGRAGLLSALRPQDVFATSVYTNDATPKKITLPFAPDLVWEKDRGRSSDHYIYDTARGSGRTLASNTTNAENTDAVGTQNARLLSDGYQSIGFLSGTTGVGWSFRRAPKFFDIVTYTGDGTSGRVIPHALGIKPGMIIVKRRNDVSSIGWAVYHRSLGAGRILYLNTTAADGPGSNGFQAEPTDANFTVGPFGDVNAAGGTYVAYLFAHDPDTTNGIVKCGSYTGTGAAGKAIDTGYPVQWALVKRTDSTSDWGIMDLLRASFDAPLYANLSAAEASQDIFDTTATGLVTKSSAFNVSGGAYAYCLIRAPI